jgi:hypothetical protein
MKKFFITLLLFLLINTKLFAGKQEMINALKGIPGVADADWAQEISLWVVMSNPNAGHDFDQMGYIICNGGVSNFSVKKGYTITFWNMYTKKPITKFQCY